VTEDFIHVNTLIRLHHPIKPKQCFQQQVEWIKTFSLLSLWFTIQIIGQ